MKEKRLIWSSILVLLCLFLVKGINGGNPYRFYDWKVTYGFIYPLGVKQQVSSLYLLTFNYLFLFIVQLILSMYLINLKIVHYSFVFKL